MGFPPSCDNYTDSGQFEHYCEAPQNQYNTTQNPCDCSTWLTCGSETTSGPCGPEQVFNPCTGECDGYFKVKSCPFFCACFDGKDWKVGKQENCRNSIQIPLQTTISAASTPLSSTTSPSDDGSNGLALGLGIGIPLLLLLLVVAFCLWRKRQWAKNPDRYPTPWYQALMILPCLPCRVLRTKLLTEHNNRSEDFYIKGYSTKLVYNVSEKKGKKIQTIKKHRHYIYFRSIFKFKQDETSNSSTTKTNVRNIQKCPTVPS